MGGGGGGANQDELTQPAHCRVLEMTSLDQSSELSSSMMIPQMTVIADLTCSELSLIPDHPVGNCQA